MGAGGGGVNDPIPLKLHTSGLHSELNNKWKGNLNLIFLKSEEAICMRKLFPFTLQTGGEGLETKDSDKKMPVYNITRAQCVLS